jgi:rhomboid protease GluP
MNDRSMNDETHGPDGRLPSPERPERGWEEIGPSAISPESRGETSSERIEAWSLVLGAQGIPHRLRGSGWGGRLLVPADRREEALTALRLYEEENRDWPPPPPAAAAGVGGIRGSLAVLLLLAVFYHVTTLRIDAFGHRPIDWLALGSNDAAKVLSGQWWRLVTALTLHADALHLLGNLLVGGVLVVLLCGEFGPGLGWSLLLLSGILGNFASALAQGPSHDAVGASTALFGAIGVLAGRSAFGGRGVPRGRFLPLAAGAALLGLLGTGGERTDLGAHLFGFLSGLVLGLLAGRRLAAHGRPDRNADAFLAAAAALLPVLTWLLALSTPR